MLVFGPDPHREGVLVRPEMTDEPKEDDVLLQRFEHRPKAEGEVAMGPGEVRRAGKNDPLLALLDEELSQCAGDGLDNRMFLRREGDAKVFEPHRGLAERPPAGLGVDVGAEPRDQPVPVQPGQVTPDIEDALLDPPSADDEDEHEPRAADADQLDVPHAGPRQ